MDLPISRIKNAEVDMQKNGDIDFYDEGYQRSLLRLTDNITSGDYVVAMNFVEGGETVDKIMSINSDYEFDTLNRRTLLNALCNSLKKKNLNIADVGLFFRTGNSKGRLNAHSLSLRIDNDTGETLLSGSLVCH